MKVNFKSVELIKVIKNVTSLFKPNSYSGIINLKVLEKKLWVEINSYEGVARETVECEIIKEGKVSVLAKSLLALLSKPEITIEKKENSVIVTGDHMKYSLSNIESSVYDKIEYKETNIDIKYLYEISKNLVSFTENDTLRPILSCMNIKDKIIEATDARILYWRDAEINGEYLIPQNFVKGLKLYNEIEDARIFTSRNSIGIIGKDIFYYVIYETGIYPNTKFLKVKTDFTINIDPSEWLEIIYRMYSVNLNTVIINIGKKSFIESINLETNVTAKEDLLIKGNPIRIGFSPKILEKALKEFGDEEIIFSYQAPEKFCVLANDKINIIVMPCIITEI